MEVSSSSYSQPLSLHKHHFPPPHHRRVSAKFNHPKSRTPLFISPNYPCTSSCSTSSSCSSYFGSPLNYVSMRVYKSNPPLKKRSFSILCGVFERFTERAIKAVMFSQKETKSLGQKMVFTQHLLLGLIMEDRSSLGFLGSGITIEKAREAVRDIWSDEIDQQGNVKGESKKLDSSSSATDVPFSVSTKRVFEAAVEYSKNMGYHFIAPEHIAIGLFTVDDGNAGRVLKRYTLLEYLNVDHDMYAKFVYVKIILWLCT